MDKQPATKKFDNPELQLAFELPAVLTIRQRLRFKGTLGSRMGADLYVRAWEAARALITGWSCPHVELDADIDQAGSVQASDAIIWATMQTFDYVESVGATEKN